LYQAAFVAIFAATPEHFWELAGQIVAIRLNVCSHAFNRRSGAACRATQWTHRAF